jgi:sugar/nucleoside kinase (ribokinase family)
MQVLRIDQRSPFRQLVGVGGLGTGVFFALEGNTTLGRNESRAGRLLDVRDYCKLHIVTHYVARLLGAGCEDFSVVPVGKVGEDAAGAFVIREMQSVGMDTRFVEVIAGKATLFSVCFQYPDGCGGNITTSNSAAGELCGEDIEKVEPVLRALGARTIALLVPEAPLEARAYFLKMAKSHGAFCAASFVSGEIAAAQRMGMLDELDLVSLNAEEAGVLEGNGFSESEPERLVQNCVALLNRRYPGMSMVVSVGRLGAYAAGKNGWKYSVAPRVEVSSTAGAGDCLLGGVLAGLAAGIPLMDSRGHSAGEVTSALDLGVLLASYKVTSPHTIHPEACLERVVEFAAGIGMSVSSEIHELVVRRAERSRHSRRDAGATLTGR